MGRVKPHISFLVSAAIIICLFSVSAQSVAESQDVDGIHTWCQMTPHPEYCRHYLSRDEHHLPRHIKDFRIMALEAALDRAYHTRDCASSLEKHSRSKRKKAVFRDCYKLVNNTILQLNETLINLKHRKISDFVAQTWLSAALTNLQTCFSGSGELNLTDFVSPIKTSNLTELISNNLAINHLFVKRTQASDRPEGFPRWFTKKDRQLLQSRSIYSRANVTVSQAKGSEFRTIQSALDYAVGIDRGDGRFIIYIKRGVYRENIEIGNDLKNIMFLGDGLRYTIITGDRSVAGGFTTYSSATVGVDGTGFIARGITFRNTAGPTMAQAVALRSASDLSVFYACSFEGYQD